MVHSKAYEINADQWPKYSSFKPLEHDTEIRVLHLEDTTGSKCLRYRLHHKNLHDLPEYRAVSYSWGPPVPISALKEVFIH